jgi:UDP-2-acetamido-2-deoxy-ribo-hexuluronate aminotransferase
MSSSSESSHRLQMVDLQTQYEEIKDEVHAAVNGVLSDAAFIRGPDVVNFEKELAAWMGGTHAVGVGNGTDALQIAFMALGIGPGDEVITTPFTFIATAEAALLLGATPVWVDIDPETFNIAPASIEQAITPRTKAIVPVHLFGQPADMTSIMDIARRHDLKVVEDNAQSIGARVNGVHAGYIGDLGCLSFFPSKNLGAYGDGGAVLTNDDGLHERVRMIANHGSRKKYVNEIVGVNSRLDTVQAAILRVKLRRLDTYIGKRRKAAALYADALHELDEIVLPVDSTGEHVYHQYTIRVRDGRQRRDSLAVFLKERAIPTAVYYPIPLHRLPVFDDSTKRLDISERAADEVLSLPMHTEMSEVMIERISDAVRAFFGKEV